MFPAVKRGKHGNEKCVHADGTKFDSRREMKRYDQLRMLERSNLISDLRLQVSYDLIPGVVLDGRKKPAIRYVADFVYIQRETGKEIIEDTKSPHLRANPAYRIKKHLMKYVHNLDITEV